MRVNITDTFHNSSFATPLQAAGFRTALFGKYLNGGGKAPRYRWHLGCILLKMPAISLLTGLGCCHHLYYLLDKNQSQLVPSDDVLSYRMKARFYFQVSRLSTPELPLQDTVASDDSWPCGDRSTSRSGTSSSTAGTGRRPWARASTTSPSARRARRRRSACIRSTPRSR